jgi:polyhydroxyalkanoate synthase subunit PhaC
LHRHDSRISGATDKDILQPWQAAGSFSRSAKHFRSARNIFCWERWADWFASLPDRKARELPLRVLRWTLDEMPLPRQLFEEVVELLYREDRFMQRTLLIRGRFAAPELIESPMLSIIEAESRVVPPESVSAISPRNPQR